MPNAILTILYEEEVHYRPERTPGRDAMPITDRVAVEVQHWTEAGNDGTARTAEREVVVLALRVMLDGKLAKAETHIMPPGLAMAKYVRQAQAAYGNEILNHPWFCVAQDGGAMVCVGTAEGKAAQ